MNPSKPLIFHILNQRPALAVFVLLLAATFSLALTAQAQQPPAAPPGFDRQPPQQPAPNQQNAAQPQPMRSGQDSTPPKLPAPRIRKMIQEPEFKKLLTSDETRIYYGFHREFPPFSYEFNTRPEGFEVELLQAVLRGRKVRLEMKPMSWENTLKSLADGGIHITSGVIKTPRRLQAFLFSKRPTIPLITSFFMRNDFRVQNNAELRGKRVGFKQETLYNKILEDIGGMNLVPFKTRVEGLRALYNGRVDAYCDADKITNYKLKLNKFDNISTVGTPLGATMLYFAVNRDKPELKAIIDQGMLAVWESGEYDRIYRKWFVPELTRREIKALPNAARKALENTYAPYSQQAEGAAVLTHSGRVYLGANVENGLPNLNMGALQTALYKAISRGETDIRAVAKVDPQGKLVTPNADERQILHEFGRGILVMTEPEPGKIITRIAAEMLPYPHELLPAWAYKRN